MAKETERTYNGSYLYRLNQELSGQQELDPYYITAAAGGDILEDSTVVQEPDDQASEDESL